MVTELPGSQVLLALEETPRYRAALRLLLDLGPARADKFKEPTAPETLLPVTKPAQTKR